MTPDLRRHTTRVITPPSKGLSLAALMFVGAALVAGVPAVAAALVAGYVVLSRVGGRAPTWHVFAWAAFMLAVIGSARVATGEGVGWELAAMVVLNVLGTVFTVWPRIGTTRSGDG